jgi:hypothetical protein
MKNAIIYGLGGVAIAALVVYIIKNKNKATAAGTHLTPEQINQPMSAQDRKVAEEGGVVKTSGGAVAAAPSVVNNNGRVSINPEAYSASVRTDLNRNQVQALNSDVVISASQTNATEVPFVIKSQAEFDTFVKQLNSANNMIYGLETQISSLQNELKTLTGTAYSAKLTKFNDAQKNRATLIIYARKKADAILQYSPAIQIARILDNPAKF